MGLVNLNAGLILGTVCSAVVTCTIPSISWADLPKLETLEEDPDRAVRGQEPKPKEVEGAFNECLRQIDEEAKDMMNSNSFRKSVVDDQTELCKKGKHSCIVTPRGAECRAFIEDYAVESLVD